MNDEFTRSFNRLGEGEHRGTIWVLGAGLLVLAGWMAWAIGARISLYEESADARLELDGATYPIESPIVGRIVAARLRVGDEVRRGDVLVELDATSERLQLEEAQVRRAGLEAPLAKLHAQIDAEQRLRIEEEGGARSSTLEAQSRVREAGIAAQFADRDLVRMRSLHAQQIVSQRDLEKAESEAGRLRIEVAALEAAAARVPQNQSARNRERDVRIARLQGEIATLEAERDTLQADTARLTYEIERRLIRAPADGRVGEAVNLQAGGIVSEGVRLASIVPAGRLLIVAQYPAPAALGRIRAGQVATLRLSGFPWAEFGTVSATVTHVAEEVRDGRVRVELTPARQSSFRGSLAHGMPGTLEVAVERVSPMGLTLRTAGQWLTRSL
jgi:membrane fusion protein (multidrug efflux system)